MPDDTIGIDISKATLDIHRLSDGKMMSFSNGSIRISYAHCLTGRIPAAAASTARGVGCLGRTAR